MRVLVTGSAGVIGALITSELRRRGHDPVPLDLADGLDARDTAVVASALEGCEHFIACAALIGGLPWLHAHPYDLLAANERIMAASFDAAIAAHRKGPLRKITIVSSSLAYESASGPLSEGMERKVPPPPSSYGFQKLAAEYFAHAAWDQYSLPFTVVRPFNAVSPGDRGHVIPDLAGKVLDGQDPLRILGSGSQFRHFTWAGDLAEGIVTAALHPAARNEDFNLASPEGTSVERLAALIWRKVRGPGQVRLMSDEPCRHDVQHRVPDVSKARDMLGFEARTTLGEMLDKVIPVIAAERAGSRLCPSA